MSDETMEELTTEEALAQAAAERALEMLRPVVLQLCKDGIPAKVLCYVLTFLTITVARNSGCAAEQCKTAMAAQCDEQWLNKEREQKNEG